jgi:hypothetical protein
MVQQMDFQLDAVIYFDEQFHVGAVMRVTV